MQKISGTKILLTRGDTFKARVAMIKDDGTEYVPEEGDRIRFAMKRAFSDVGVTLEKEIPIDTQMLSLEPADTKELECGGYVYDIQLTYSNGDVDTFISRSSLELTEEVN